MTECHNDGWVNKWAKIVGGPVGKQCISESDRKCARLGKCPSAQAVLQYVRVSRLLIRGWMHFHFLSPFYMVRCRIYICPFSFFCTFNIQQKTVVSAKMVNFTLFFQPNGKGKRLPEVYCIVSHLGCFNLFSKVNSSPVVPCGSDYQTLFMSSHHLKWHKINNQGSHSSHEFFMF